MSMLKALVLIPLLALPVLAAENELAVIPYPNPPIAYTRFHGDEPWVRARNVMVTLHNMLLLRDYHLKAHKAGGAQPRYRASYREEQRALERELLAYLAWARKNRSIDAKEPEKNADWLKEVAKMNNADPAAVRAAPKKPVED